MDVMTAIELTDNEFLRQFEATIDGKMAKIEYSLQDRKIFLTKIKMPEGTEDKMNDFIVFLKKSKIATSVWSLQVLRSQSL